MQPYNNVWLVVPTSVAENFAVSSQTVDLGTGSEGEWKGHRRSKEGEVDYFMPRMEFLPLLWDV